MNYLVVGAEERDDRAVNVRNRDDKATQTKGELVPLSVALEKLVQLKKERRIINAM